MFEKFIVVDNKVSNVTDAGQVVGFEFHSRITYYRGMGVSMVEPFEISVDGGPVIPAENLRFSIGGRTWTFAELEVDYDTRWELMDEATVTVLVPGGLTPGKHHLDVTEVLRISYLPSPSRSNLSCDVLVA